MDPLTAFSLAGTVVQFVDFGTRLFTDCRELYKSTGEKLAAHEEKELLTKDLVALIDKLRRPGFCSANGNSDISENILEIKTPLELLCNQAGTIAEEILNKFNKFTIPKDARTSGSKLKRVVRSLQQAIKIGWSHSEIEGLLERLRELRKSIDTNILFNLRESINAQAIQNSARFDRVDHQTQHIFLSLLESQSKASQEIITTLAQMASRLEVLNEDTHHQAEHLQVNRFDIRESAETYRDLDIATGIEMLAVSPGKEEIHRQRVTAAIIKSLHYPKMTSRYANIKEAFPETLEWAFNDSMNDQLPWTNFAEWLKTGEGIYWVNGKAGSGKSILMKHAFDDQRTRQYLQEWSRTTDSSNDLLVIATFFFWNTGCPEQRSQIGLLRALLHQVLVQNPKFAPIAFPTMWADLYSNFLDDVKRAKYSSDSWSLRHLKDGFMRVIKQTHLPQKLFFMIDGLDEFDGDHEYLVELFHEITLPKQASCRAKACLSSRPWVIFQESFKSCASLKLQNLTFVDIETFVDQKLRSNDSFRELADDEPNDSQRLILEIVERADGVWLWVRLVVKSLLDGLRNLDDISHLWKRLLLLPKELEPLYEHLIGLIEPVYLEWVSKVFRILCVSQELGDNNVSLVVLFLAMNENLDLKDVQKLSSQYLISKCCRIIIQLTARCAGFLEVATPACQEVQEPTVATISDSPDSSIVFFHRTAYDFIKGQRQWALIVAPTILTSFSPSFALARACALWASVERLHPFKHDRNYTYGFLFSAFISDAMKYARQAEGEGIPFSRLSDVVEGYLKSYPTSTISLSGLRPLEVLDLAALFGLKEYFLERVPRLRLNDLSSLLNLLLLDDSDLHRESLSVPEASPEIISAIIAHGGVLNKSSPKITSGMNARAVLNESMERPAVVKSIQFNNKPVSRPLNWTTRLKRRMIVKSVGTVEQGK